MMKKYIALSFFMSFVWLWFIANFLNMFYIQSQGDPEIEIDRSCTWLRARQDSDGNYKSEEVQKIAMDIVSYPFML